MSIGVASTDVVVVGGGPAGSTVAALIAKAGYDVVLLEKERFPRYHIGESLLPSTVHGVCELLGVREDVEKAGFVRKHGGTFRWGNNPIPWTFGFGEAKVSEERVADYALQVERSRFDALLLDNARRVGVDVREEHSVVSARVHSGRTSGVTYRAPGGTEGWLDARYVVDASGASGVVAARVGERTYDPFFRNVAVFGYFEGGKRDPDPRLRGNILSEAFGRGWAWYIPLGDTLTSVGVVLSREELPRLQREGVERAYRLYLEECPIIRSYLAEAQSVTTGQYAPVRVARDYSYTNTQFVAPGAVMIGDAACFVDPVFSSGVHLATYSAVLAARSINTSLSGALPEALVFDEFEYRYRREFAVFYEFLIAFYEMHQDTESYFWSARKILGRGGPARDAFVRLVAGLSSRDEPVFEFASISELQESVRNSASLMQAVGDAQSADGNLPDELEHELRNKAGPRLQARRSLIERSPEEAPVRSHGLVPSADGLHWVQFTSVEGRGDGR